MHRIKQPSFCAWGFVLGIFLAPVVARAQCTIYLNEILLDETDLLELHNTSDQEIDLSGWVIDGGGGCLQLGDGLSIAAHGYLVVEAEERILDPIGAAAILMDDEERPQDIFEYGDQGGGPSPIEGASIARAPDGSALPPRFPENPAPYWTLDFDPTMGFPNDAPLPDLGSSARINEIDPTAAFPQQDRIELFNPTVSPIDLTGWFLTLGASKTQHALAGVIDPGAWSTILLDPELDLDESKLVYLFDSGGVRVDQAGWRDAPVLENGECLARFPDGDGAADGYDFETSNLIVAFSSPGAANCGASAECDTTLFSADREYEDRFAWGDSAVAGPDFGAFAECFTGEVDLCAIVLDLTQDGSYAGETLDLFIWEDNGGEPGAVLHMIPGVDPGVPAEWPEVSEHVFGVCGVTTPETWWAGYWGNWPGGNAGFAVGADLNGGPGCPYTNIAPGTGFPMGWQPASVAFGPVNALGIGVYAHTSPFEIPRRELSLGETAMGACCLSDSLCEIRGKLQCLADCGDYRGDDTSCEPSPCRFRVVEVDPTNGAEHVDPRTVVTATFTEPIDPLALPDRFRLRGENLGFIPGNVSVVEDTVALFEPLLPPDGGLGAGQLMEAQISRQLTAASGSVLTRSYAWRFRTRAQRGTGGFDSKSNPVGANLVAIAAGDLDADLDLDMVACATTCPCDTVLFLYENVTEKGGPITFRRAMSEPIGNVLTAVALTDMNGDGHLDILTSDQGSNVATPDDWVHIGLGIPDEPFHFTWRSIPTEKDPQRLAPGDFDGDGWMDFAVPCERSNVVQVFLGDGAGGVRDSGRYPIPQVPRDLATADLDLDGDLDLLAMSAASDSGRITIFHNWTSVSDPDSLFRRMCTLTLPSMSGLLVDTIDDDRFPDLVVVRDDADSVCVFPTGPAGLPHHQHCYGIGLFQTATDSLRGIAALDFDGDEDLDLAITARTSIPPRWTLFENMGDGMIEAQQWFSTPLRPQLPLAADLNGDGIVDVAVPGRVGRSFSTYAGRRPPASVEDLPGAPLSRFLGNPNPFRDAVVFAAAPDEPARLEVFDPGGRLVSRVDAVPTRDRPSVTWTGTDMQGRTVAAGVYHVRLRQGSSTRTASVLRLD